MKEKIFNFLRNIYKKLPVGYSTRNRLKSGFYRMFGFAFKNMSSYKVWNAMNVLPELYDKTEIDIAEAMKFEFKGSFAIQLHLYYTDLTEEFAAYFENIPFTFDIFVSMTDKSKEGYVRQRFEKVKNADKVVIKFVPNRGRDVAPFIVSFGKEISGYDYVCHIHSKKSLFTGGEQTEWRKYLLDSLMGSDETVRCNFYALANEEKVGLLYPDSFKCMPYWGHTWLQNRAAGRQLLNMINVNASCEENYIDYPMGTMFIAKTEAIRQFLESGLKTEDFPKEAGQTDGTIAHAFERCLGIVCRHNGFNVLVKQQKQGVYLYNYGNKNLNQYLAKSYAHLKEELSEYDAVSFDIFDTLIARRISAPSEAYGLTEIAADREFGFETDFKNRRLSAEEECRRINPENDCDLDDIYDRILSNGFFDKRQTERLKELEILTEENLCVPDFKMADVLKYAKHKLGKDVFVVTDMYLRRQDILKLLEKAGIAESDFDGLFISSEMNLRKDNGSMWRHYSGLMTDEKGHMKKCLHIGDNEVSDVQLAGDYGISNYHIMSQNSLFELSNIGRKIRIMNVENPSESVMKGLVLNKCFGNPFRLNESELKLDKMDSREAGYALFGPAVLNYTLYLCGEAVRLNAGKVLFCAREGYLLREIYEMFRKSGIGKNEKLPESEYIYVSRRALSTASVKNENELFLPLEMFYVGSMKELFRTRYGYEMENEADREIILPDQKQRAEKVINEHKEEFLEICRKERENYLGYINGVLDGINKDSRIVLSDIGYSGSIQYYLSLITERGFDGRYFATDEKKKPEAISGNTITGFFIDNDADQIVSESAIHRYHLLMESVLIAPDGQLEKIGEDGKPVFTEKVNELYSEEIKKIHEGIKEYAADYIQTIGAALVFEPVSTRFAEDMYSLIIKEDILSEETAETLKIDDKFCTGEIRNAVEFYKERML